MTPDEFAEATGMPLEKWAYRCHEASLALVQSGAFDVARVARGTCPGVGGQHSWVVLGTDCYGSAPIVDPTLWSYQKVDPYLWEGSPDLMPHRPHGWGSIWQWGKPESRGGDPIPLEGLSEFAQSFLDLLGPLDLAGWMDLGNAPVQGWPAAEVIAAMYQHPALRAVVPIDRVGMLTDLNPQGLYLPERSAA